MPAEESVPRFGETVGPGERERLLGSTINALDEGIFQSLTESSPVGMFIADGNRRVLYLNPEAERQAGRNLEQFQALGWLEVIHPDDRDSVAEAHRRFRDQGEPYIDEHRIVRSDGSVCWVRERVALLTNDLGETLGVVGTSADITDLRLADQRLRESEERTRAIIETAAEGIVTYDSQATIVEFNAAAERLFGYDSDEIVGKVRFDALLAPPQRDVVFSYFDGSLPDGGSSRGPSRQSIEVNCQHRDGTIVPAELALTDVFTSEGRLFTAVLRDLSERKTFEHELEHQATHDSLTGLPNRALLVVELEAALNRAAGRRSSMSVLFIELGRLKVVTDSLGHRAGDQLILDAAHRIERIVGPIGTLTRFGGGHFVAFFEEIADVGEAVDVATQIIEAVDQPFVIGDEEAFIRATIGISFAPSGASTAEALIGNADVAMNRAKVRGGAGFEVFDAEMRAWVDKTRKLEIAMRHAIERGEFELYYQPVVSITSKKVHGFEALVRWNHPELGLLPPADFIPLAESTGLIIPLGEWILQNACHQIAAWQKKFEGHDLHVSVNLSGVQLALPNLARTVDDALRNAQADPDRLDLEITETVLLDDVDRAARTLDDLKRIG